MGIPRGSGIRGKIGLSALRSKNASTSVVSGHLAPTKTSSGRPFFAFMFFQIPDSTIARPNRLLIRGLILLLAFIGFAGAVMVAAPARSQQLTSPDQVPEGLAKSDWSSIRAADEAGRPCLSAHGHRLAGAQSRPAVDDFGGPPKRKPLSRQPKVQSPTAFGLRPFL
jgi:hypothetical protein